MAEGAPFRPEEHRFGPTHWFEDLKVGQTFYINSRTQTESMFAAFQLASGDNHPIHYDREYCRARGHRDMLAHGLQVAIQGAAGAGIFPHVIGDSLVGFLEQSSRFLKPVYCGDTLYPLLEVSELRPGRTTGVVTMKLTIHNQAGVLVCDGEHKYLVKKRPQ
jgi:acyl dehydratase